MISSLQFSCLLAGDGSAWIWNTAAELFPQATQILDRFHPKEHLSKVGKVIYGDSEPGNKWIQRRYDELDSGRLASLLRALCRHAECQQVLECSDYVRKNRERMRYPEFGMQSRHRDQSQAGWHALDGEWRQRHHCPALL